MVALQFRTWSGQGVDADPLAQDIRDFHLDAASGHLVQVSSSGLVSYRLSEGGVPVQVDTVIFPSALGSALSDDATVLEMAGAAPCLVLGATEAGLWGYDLAGAGQFGPLAQQALPAPEGTALSGLEQGGGFVYVAGAGGQGIGTYETGPAGDLVFVDRTSDAAGAQDVVALCQVSLGSGEFLISANRGEAKISSWQIDAATGELALQDGVGMDQGLGILPAITAMEVVTVGGQTMVLVASSSTTGGMGALSVLTLDAQGGLTATDHLLDTLNTRFGQVQDIAVVEAGGRLYVAAGGGDDGLSLFVMMPDGRLQYLASQEDTDALGLDNLAALALTQQGDEVQVIAAGQGEAGLTQFAFDVDQGISLVAGEAGGLLSGSAGGDALAGGGGHDLIAAGAGDDILSDGAGRDTLTGGAGADIFALRSDGDTDRITDFDIQSDHLDLSGLRMFYDPGRLDITATSWGALVDWFGESLEVYSADGGALDPEAVRARVMTGADRPLLLVPRRAQGSESADSLQGHDGSDEMTGGQGNDTLEGLGGADTILGGDGYDSLHAGQGDDVVAGGNGRDHVRLGVGDDIFYDVAQNDVHGQDTILADAGDDTVMGGGGDDLVQGHAGYDLIYGGVGADRLFGGTGFDTLRGGDGDDMVVGGDGRDLAFLGQGDDVFHDNAQGGAVGSDTVWAGRGNDEVQGGNGADKAFGEGGADLLIGRLGNDSLFGGDQDDTLSGGEGDDLVVGGKGRDRAFLGSGDDRYFDNDQSDQFGRDRVWGGAGDDTINAGGGDDTLSGEAGADVFIFNPTEGDRVVTDFEAGIDTVQLTMSGVFMSDTTAGALLDWQQGTVLLEGVTLSDLDPGDIVFV